MPLPCIALPSIPVHFSLSSHLYWPTSFGKWQERKWCGWKGASLPGSVSASTSTADRNDRIGFLGFISQLGVDPRFWNLNVVRNYFWFKSTMLYVLRDLRPSTWMTLSTPSVMLPVRGFPHHWSRWARCFGQAGGMRKWKVSEVLQGEKENRCSEWALVAIKTENQFILMWWQLYFCCFNAASAGKPMME